MAFIDKVLQAPSYGWADKNEKLVVPSASLLFKEAFSRINIFKSKKNWMPFFSWSVTICLLPFFIVQLIYFASWFNAGLIFIYGMIFMSTQGTIWLHRYSTHKSFEFSHPIWRFITQNLVIRTIPEETYVISHHVHHVKSDLPGDPYNSKAGLLYCMLADVNHQGIDTNLNEDDYNKAYMLMKHVGVKLNSYKQYKKWGSVTSPLYTLVLLLANWAFWYGIFFLIGGHAIATGMFTAAMFWFVIVRAFNYTGHGGGQDKHQDGIDFDKSNLSINEVRPGYFSGEWHNNHHLYPKSARSGFLPYQLDMAWVYIYGLSKIGAVSRYQDDKKKFLAKYVNK
jgi:fatty-acid desaturase